MERDRHFRIQFQQFHQQLIRKAPKPKSANRRRLPCGSHPEQTAEPEIKAVRGDKVFVESPVLGIMSHEKENGSFPPGGAVHAEAQTFQTG